MHNKKRVFIVFIGIFALICYISISYARLVVPQPNLFIYRGDGEAAVFTYHDNGTKHECALDGDFYNAEGVIINGQSLNVRFKLLPDSIGACFVNEETVSENCVYDVGEWCNFTDVNRIYVITLPAKGLSFYLYALGMFVFLSVLTIGIYIHRKEVLSLFSAVKDIGAKAFLVSFVVTLVSCIMFYGCDFVPIVGSVNLVQKGIDPYQLSAAFNAYFERAFMYWPYNPGMLIFWDVVMSINRFFCNVYINYYMWLQCILVKFINILLLNGTVVIVLSVIKEKGFVGKEKLTELYYWSVFNPCVFWVAIIFIQFDMFAVFFVTLGAAICSKTKKTWWIGIAVGIIGCLAKQQEYLCIPILLLELFVLFYSALQDEKCVIGSLIELGKALVAFIVTVILGIAIFYIKGGAVFETLSNNPQSGRIWYGTVNLGANAFVSAFMLVLMMLLWMQQISLKHEKIVVLSSFLYFGLLQMALAFSIASTPGSYMMLAPAMTVVYCLTHDRLQRLLISCSSIMICTVEIFSAIGDITRSAYFLGKDPYFTNLYVRLGNTPYPSILFSISHATMLAFVILLYKKQLLLSLRGNGIY